MADWREKFYGQHHAKKIAKIESNIKELVSILRPEHSLLDVGCNIGALYQFLGHGNYQGIDLDPKCIEAAKSAFPWVDFKVGDLYDLDGEWDVVVVSRVLMHVAPLDQAMRILLKSAKRFLVLFVPIGHEDVCEVQGHDLDGVKVYSYFRTFSEYTLRSFGRCGIYRHEPYSTVIYGR